MYKIIHQSLLENNKIEKKLKLKYSLIIPAAGKGSRLGYNRAKILYPICGFPILFYVLKPFLSYVDEIIIIINPKDQNEIQRELDHLNLNLKIKFSFQAEPLGMAHAINCAEDNISNSNLIVIWGDQVGYTSNTIRCLIQLFETNLGVSMCLPTKIVEDPYINIIRNNDQEIVEVQQKRESNNLPLLGESDGGLFIFDKKILLNIIKKELEKARFIGSETGEFNLLPLFPEFEKEGTVLTMQLSDINETIGINSLGDVEIAERKFMVENRNEKK